MPLFASQADPCFFEYSRYMALSDLMAEARKDGFHNVDDRTESSTITKVLDLIKDQNGEVKNMSVKW
jgi:hypothetical protein